ncbi:MAG: hypothetical protein M3370_06380 [Actinomycetota bacterium]|nr:hypothetical protein [Actinomycetota bacterium]
MADHREQLDAVAGAPLEHETLEEDAIYSVMDLEGQPDRGEAAPAPASG